MYVNDNFHICKILLEFKKKTLFLVKKKFKKNFTHIFYINAD